MTDMKVTEMNRMPFKKPALLLGWLASLLLGSLQAAQAYTNEVYQSSGLYYWKVDNVVAGSTTNLTTAINSCVWNSTGVRDIHILVGGQLTSAIGLPPNVQVYCHSNSFGQSTNDANLFFGKYVTNVGVHDIIITNGGYMPLYFTGCNDVSLSGISIYSGYIGIRVESHASNPWNFWSYGLTITNCFFQNLLSHGIETYGIDGAYVDNIVSRTNGECGVLFNDTKHATVGTIDSTRCCYGGGYAGLRFANGCSDCTVKYLRAVECGRGLFFVTGASNIVVQEVYIRDCTWHAILIQNSDEVGINSGTYNGLYVYHYTSINSWNLATDVSSSTNVALNAPTGLTAAASTNGIGLSWPAMTGATNYLLQRATTNGGPYSAIAYLDTTNYLDKGVSGDTNYYYILKAINDAGPSAASVQVSATAIAPSVSPASGLQRYYPFDGSVADAKSGSSVSYSGTQSYAAGLINQSVVLDGSTNFSTLQSLSSASYRNFSMATWVWNSSNTDWQRIFDFGSSITNYMMLCRVYSTIRFQMLLGDARTAFEVSAPPLGRWFHVALTFSGNWATLYINGEAKKAIFYTYNPTSFSLTQNYLGKSRFVDPLLQGKLDDFRLYDRELSAAEVMQMVMSAPPLPPFGLVAGAFGTRVNLQWSGVVNAATYNVKRATISGGPYSTIATGLTNTTYSDTNVIIGTTYYYVVSGSSTNGESVNSEESTAFISDLVARLRFDETSGTNAFDTSGNSWDGALVNGPVWTNGMLKRAVNLSGASQYVSLPAGVVSGLNNSTICAWVKVSSFNTWSRIFDFGSATTNYMFLTAQYDASAANAAKLRFAIRTAAIAEQQISSSVAIASNAWVHVAVTLSNTTGRIYINGTQTGINSSMSLKPSSLGNTTQNYLGRSQFADPYFAGALDDLRIYARALTGAELTALANPVAEAPDTLQAITDDRKVTLIWDIGNAAASYQVKRAAVSGGPYTVIATGVTNTTFTDTGLTNGQSYYYVVSSVNGLGESSNSFEVTAVPSPLRLWLRFDEITGTNAMDSTGNGLNGTLINSAAFASGHEGNALNLVAASSQYATLPAGVVSGLSNFTVAAWVNLTSVANWNRIFDFGNSTTTYMFLSPQNGNTGKLRFGITTNSTGGEQQINTSVTMPTNGWHHLAVTLSGSSGVLYLDGVVVGTTNAMTLNPATLGSTINNYIGKSQWNDPYLNGKVDDFQLYSTALTAGEVATFLSPLAAPGNPSAIAVDGQAALKWNVSANATRYHILRSLADGGPYTQVALVTSTNFTDVGLTNGTPYFYVVMAANAVDESPLSAQVSVIPVSTVPPLTSATMNGGSLTLSWPSDRTGWRLQVQTNASAMGLGTNWFDVPGSMTTNSMNLPVNLLNSSVFYRMIYP